MPPGRIPRRAQETPRDPDPAGGACVYFTSIMLREALKPSVVNRYT
jgi:hypothetical protein